MRYFVLILSFLISSSINRAQSIGGTLSSNTLVCIGNNNGTLSVSGYSGSITRWEYAYGSSGPWSPMIFTSTTYNYINLSQSTYFRVIVQLPGYSEAASNTIIVSCDNPSIAGVVTTNTFQCINSPAYFTLSANSGSVIAWESSTNNWVTTNTITTTNTLIATLASLTSTTQIRAKVQNGVCPSVFSNSVTIYPASNSVGGNISGTQNVCAGSNSSTLTLNNYTGLVQYWESSISSGGPFNLISSSSPTLSYINLNQTTWYRAQVKNGTCVSSISSLFIVNVDQPSIGGSIIGTQNVCAQINSGSLQLIANTGSVAFWQTSVNSTTWNTISNNNSVLSFSNLSNSSIFRVGVQNGICPTVYSNQFTVSVNPLPILGFSMVSACEQSPVNFSNTTSGSNSYAWDFGDGGSANIYNPIHSYLAHGSYTVKLIATTMQNCRDSLKLPLSIYPKPSVNYFSADTACFGNSILFSNSSTLVTGSITQLKFNFGDGSQSSSMSPVTHYFLSEGIYSVSLRATSNFGCRDSISKIISIYPKPNSNFLAPNACKGSMVTFNNLSLITNGFIQNNWAFGNSSSSNLPSPNYTFLNAGTYTVCLISTSDHNCKDTALKVVSIHEKPSITFSANNSCLGASVLFQSTLSPANLSTSITVNFGDGSLSNNPSPTHSYTTSGTFVYSIVAVTDSGCVSSISKNITIYSKPFANFNCKDICNSDSAIMINTSSIANGSMTYTWNLSPTYTSIVNSPKHLYNNSGNYTISLIAKSDYDCTDTITKPLTVFDSPSAEFIFNNKCDGFPLTFTNTSTIHSGIISNNIWHFGDNSISTEINPIKEYLNKGTYIVTLITQTGNGCSDTIKKTVAVFEEPIADFSANQACKNTATTFSNSSILSSGSFSSSWRFGDTTVSIKNSPTHLYQKAGIFKVQLKIISNSNCVDSVSKFIEILNLPKVVALKDTSIEKGFGIYLQANGAVNYKWFPPIGLSNPTVFNPYSNPDSSITYIVEGTDVHGCINSDTLRVTVKDNFLLIPYNILTPDANGKNETWIVKNIETYPQNSVVIFDEWNQMVFQKENYANEWEGKNMRGEILPDATYYYILRFKNNSKVYSGYITLLRNGK